MVSLGLLRIKGRRKCRTCRPVVAPWTRARTHPHTRGASPHAVMSDEKSGSISSTIVALPDFPGEEVLSHEGRMWKAATITKFAAHELISVVETGVHPAMNEIIIVDVSVRSS